MPAGDQQAVTADGLARRPAAVDPRVATALAQTERAAEVLLDLARPIPAEFTEAQDVALDLVEQRRPQRRLELRAHEARPPGVHQRDRCAVVVHVVPVRVEPVAARAAPRIEDPKHALALAPPVADR